MRNQTTRGTRLFNIVILLWVLSVGIRGEQSKPPLLPEGQVIPDIETLVKNISSAGPVLAVAFSPDGKTIASGSWDNTVRLWDISSAKETATIVGHTSSVNSVSFSPDGKTIASGSADNKVRLWDISSAKETAILRGHTSSVTSVSFSPDGKTIASGSDDNTVRLWDISSAKETAILRGHTSFVTSVSFSPDGKTIAAWDYRGELLIWDVSTGQIIADSPWKPIFSNSGKISRHGNLIASIDEDARIRIRDQSSERLLMTFIAGKQGNWLSYNADRRVWRYDDGTFLVTRDKLGRPSPVYFPRPASPGVLRILNKPDSLTTLDGKTTTVSLTLKNDGQGPLYHLNVIASVDRTSPLQFFRPETIVLLEPGRTIELKCAVSAFSPYTNPLEGRALLPLTISSDFTTPLSLELPVHIRVPQLKFLYAELQNRDKPVLVVAMQNTGSQDISTAAEFKGKIQNVSHDTVTLDIITRSAIKAGETFDIAFSIPNRLKLDKNTRLDLTVATTQPPIHEWQFHQEPVSIPFPPLLLYILLGVLVSAAAAVIFIVRNYQHPLTQELSRNPHHLRELPPRQLRPALKLLRRTRRLSSIMDRLSLSSQRLHDALAFCQSQDAPRRALQLAALLEADVEALPGPALFQFTMNPRFLLNNRKFRVAFPPAHMSPEEINKTYLTRDWDNHTGVCLFFSLEDSQNHYLRKISRTRDNPFVTPSPEEITSLLLAADPMQSISRLIATQIKLAYISPYRYGGGIDQDSIFYGREKLLSHILQRKPANYLVVGGRQLGKSSLLKAVHRRLENDPHRQSRYFDLGEKSLQRSLCDALDLPLDTPLEKLFVQIKQKSADRHLTFLIDEADKFIQEEVKNNYPMLRHLRTLSEEGHCRFILAGYWELFHAAVFDFHSPIRNFGETLRIEELDQEAAYNFAVTPMAHLNIQYESEDVITTLLHRTGRRANLIAIVCSEILQDAPLTDGIIYMTDLEKALDSNEVYNSLNKWTSDTSNPDAALLDQIIVYTTIRKESFTLVDVLDAHIPLDPEQVKQALARLTLNYILKREKENYRYSVPLFKTQLISQEPEKILSHILNQKQNPGTAPSA